MSKLPKNLPPRDPQALTFPTVWKESYFMRNFNENWGGYVCPDCDKVFLGPADFRRLEAEHIKPQADGGLTVWENLILRCKPCSLAKRKEQRAVAKLSNAQF